MRLLKETPAGDETLSRKLLMEIASDLHVEFAYLEFHDKHGISRGCCLSAQLGCAVGCKQCMTSYMVPRAFLRNLTASEIIQYIQLGVNHLQEKIPALQHGAALQFADFSGVGDCAYNWFAVRDAMAVLVPDLFERFTVSSIAPLKWIQCLLDSSDQAMLPERVAVSLHGGTQEIRQRLIPCAEDPIVALPVWGTLMDRNIRLILNYVIHKGNTGPRELDALVFLLANNRSNFDLLRLSPLNDVPDMQVEHSPLSTTQVRGHLIKALPWLPVVEFKPIGTHRHMGCGQMRAKECMQAYAVDSQALDVPSKSESGGKSQ
jgi:23S rRNA (adenine2503-C2)-methyltransferase